MLIVLGSAAGVSIAGLFTAGFAIAMVLLLVLAALARWKARDESREDVRLTRATGHAFNPGRALAKSWGIGRALHFPGGRLAGALSLAAIDGRMGEDRRRDLAALLAEEAAEIETKLDRLFRAEAGAPQGGAPATPDPIRHKRTKT